MSTINNSKPTTTETTVRVPDHRARIAGDAFIGGFRAGRDAAKVIASDEESALAGMADPRASADAETVLRVFAASAGLADQKRVRKAQRAAARTLAAHPDSPARELVKRIDALLAAQ